jgi:hypothetical protein
VKFWAKAGAARVRKAAHKHRAATAACPVRKMNSERNDFEFDAFDRNDWGIKCLNFNMSKFWFK